jgi:molecular chaperone HscB
MPPAADKNYFELFGLPVAFELDVGNLSVRYRELARESHPDRFASGSASERRLATQMAALLNEAFRTLKEPISRAAYLLALKQATLPSGTVAAVAPAFLMQQMELRERLDDMRGDRKGLDGLASDVRQSLQDREWMLRTQLAPATWQPEQALRTVQEMQFLDKLRHQIADLQEESA